MPADSYPRWKSYPLNVAPAPWVADVVAVVGQARAGIDTATVLEGITSDAVLRAIRPGLEAIGFEVERSKLASDRITRPVLFGGSGRPVVTYEVDAVHDALGIVVEVEAGRGAMSNAVYRDLIRASLSSTRTTWCSP